MEIPYFNNKKHSAKVVLLAPGWNTIGIGKCKRDNRSFKIKTVVLEG